MYLVFTRVSDGSYCRRFRCLLLCLLWIAIYCLCCVYFNGLSRDYTCCNISRSACLSVRLLSCLSVCICIYPLSVCVTDCTLVAVCLVRQPASQLLSVYLCQKCLSRLAGSHRTGRSHAFVRLSRNVDFVLPVVTKPDLAVYLSVCLKMLILLCRQSQNRT